MNIGLVLGKFYPLHLGHIELIKFAEERCDKTIVLICASDKEKIDGTTRLNWVCETFSGHQKIEPVLLNYSEQELPNTSESSRSVSKIWALKIAKILTKVDVIFSSEAYGNYLAEFLNCDHIPYEPERTSNSISATAIRANPYKHWNFISASAKPFFVKKICFYGTESTGKSTLTKKLAAYYKTTYVPEMARDVIAKTDHCTENHLIEIAELHANTIEKKLHLANKLLFVDTDLNITRSYSKFLFNKKLIVDQWVENLNHFDLYLYLENDAPYIQDGTRLVKNKRDELDIFHKKELVNRGIQFQSITGDWEERFRKSILIIEQELGLHKTPYSEDRIKRN
ncbi:MAG: multifunctional transcriptional regulator/nicotinamide-nucleotide adenylyltransferase/ribosylnicotinamide kinase NadR [Saprospiraceae bacterium]